MEILKEEKQKQILIDLMHDKYYRPMKFKELAVLLGVSKERRTELKMVLDILVEEGKIGLSSHGKYGKPELFTLKGIYSSSTRGFGFVEVEGREQDIFIPADEVNGALHQDTVLVSVTHSKENGKREEGRILKILEHGITQVVGTYQKNKKFGFVIPDNKRIQSDIFVEPKNSAEAVSGTKVVVKLISYGDAHKSPEGIVTEILGNRNSPGTDILSIAKSYEIPQEWNEDVQNQLLTIPNEVAEEEKKGRMDLRAWPTVTIDGEDAKDLDDAITLSCENGIYHLGVHIADVTHYVKEHSALDEEAKKRGTSVYLIDRVIPMLPKELSNGICSLNEGKDRLALSCLMDIDSKGNVISHQIVQSLICVNHRMNYSDVAAILERQDEELKERYSDMTDMFEQMEDLSALLRKKRFLRGAIDFDFPEAKIILDEKGKPKDIKPYERNTATKLIEDFMLLANETIAEEYFWQELPFVYRVHEKPEQKKIESFAAFINNFGYSLHLSNGEIHPKELQKLMERIEGTDEEALISRLLLRSMRQARYSPENTEHFGLSAKYYCHFTSPIRRYPDLQIHRIIKENLEGRLTEKRVEHYESILPGVCEQSGKTERRAQEAEREVEKLKKAQYMKRFIGKQFEAVISGVTGYGFYVELPNTVEGMVHISNLDDDYYTFIEDSCQLVGDMTGKTYRLGQKINVIVSSVDTELKTVEFLLPFSWEEYEDE